MSLYKNAFWWFILLAVILVLGFWPSYFSKLGSVEHFTHHFHAIAMLAWLSLLVIQSWLIRNRRNDRHRSIGRISFAVAPAVVVSGTMVALHNLAEADDPANPRSVSIFWFSIFLVVLFSLLYVLAIRNRRQMKLHAPYMMATGFVFLLPGLIRVVNRFLVPLDIWTPSFVQMMFIPLMFGAWLSFQDRRQGRPLTPFMVSNAAWAIHLLGFFWFYASAPFAAVALWAANTFG